ncbi:hypothetical protein GOV05_00745 [Candidatus Woesearchaeota archaeon]|nr:hypothetical protein [Candidatus Woesearchaeota archaeon]
MKDKKKFLNISVVVSLIGLFVLYLVFINSKAVFVEASEVDESFVSKTINSRVIVSSSKNYEDATVVYVKNNYFKLVINQNITLEEDSIISFDGVVDEDEFGLVVFVKKMSVNK